MNPVCKPFAKPGDFQTNAGIHFTGNFPYHEPSACWISDHSNGFHAIRLTANWLCKPTNMVLQPQINAFHTVYEPKIHQHFHDGSPLIRIRHHAFTRAMSFEAESRPSSASIAAGHPRPDPD